MMLKIALRNVFRQKRRSILTVLTMFGGFTLAAFSIGWTDGTYNRVIDMFTRNRLGHIQIHREGYLDRPSIYKTIDDYERVGRAVDRNGGVDSWAPRLYAAGLASVGEKTSAVRIIGIDPLMEVSSTRFDRKIVSGRSLSTTAAGETAIGEGLADLLDAKAGDTLVVVSQAADGSIANDLYIITGLVSTGDPLTDRMSMYLHLADAQELFVLDGRIHEIAVVLTDIEAVDLTVPVMQSDIDDDDLVVAGWKDFAREFYKAMEVDRQGGWIMLFIVALVVAVGVLNTVLMTVLERRREYGLLRAVGTRPGQLFRLVLLEVLVMAIVSIILGCGAGYLLNYALSIHGVPVPGETLTYGGMVFDRMYTEVNAQSFYIPAVCVLLTALIVSIVPALRAARVAPARTMRIH
jgi:ABC-type lipoprotein release transport system permease subunit